MKKNKKILLTVSQFRNLDELYAYLLSLDEKTFSMYVNDRRHDIYQLVKEGYQNKSLADDLLQCLNKEAVLHCLRYSLPNFSSPALKRKVLKAKETRASIPVVRAEPLHKVVGNIKEVFRRGT